MRIAFASIIAVLILGTTLLSQTKPTESLSPVDSVRTVSVRDQIAAIEKQQLQLQTQHAQLEAIKQYLMQVRQDSLRVQP